MIAFKEYEILKNSVLAQISPVKQSIVDFSKTSSLFLFLTNVHPIQGLRATKGRGLLSMESASQTQI